MGLKEVLYAFDPTTQKKAILANGIVSPKIEDREGTEYQFAIVQLTDLLSESYIRVSYCEQPERGEWLTEVMKLSRSELLEERKGILSELTQIEEERHKDAKINILCGSLAEAAPVLVGCLGCVFSDVGSALHNISFMTAIFGCGAIIFDLGKRISHYFNQRNEEKIQPRINALMSQKQIIGGWLEVVR